MAKKIDHGAQMLYICDLKKTGNAEMLCRLTNSPCFRCGICGDVANRAENLCDRCPVRIGQK